MSGMREYEATLNLESGRVCLDFANTNDWHASERPVETLKTYVDLVNWAEARRLLSRAEAKRLRQAGARQPEAAEAVRAEAARFREAMYAVFLAHIRGRPAGANDLATLDAGLERALAHARVRPEGEGFAWQWAGPPDALDRMLWPIGHSAAELLTSPELERVGQCADERGCGWLFLDTTKNRSRRWCAMKDCGNRAKARRHYARRKKAEPAR
jgi:predicted RNA-binding Zn ribbon-like protein